MLHSKKLQQNLDNLKSQDTAKLKNAAIAIHILETTISIRNNTKDAFDIKNDIEVCNRAIDCIKEDINYDVYLDID